MPSWQLQCVSTLARMPTARSGYDCLACSVDSLTGRPLIPASRFPACLASSLPADWKAGEGRGWSWGPHLLIFGVRTQSVHAPQAAGSLCSAPGAQSCQRGGWLARWLSCWASLAAEQSHVLLVVALGAANGCLWLPQEESRTLCTQAPRLAEPPGWPLCSFGGNGGLRWVQPQ